MSGKSRILVLNPNSSVAVTQKMQLGSAGLAELEQFDVVFETLPGGPEGIESQRDVESVVIPTCDYLHQHPADAYVIGCYSDPGLLLAREELSAPVEGLAEASFRMAMETGGTFGIVSIKESSIIRHKRAVAMIGATDRLAGDRALDLGVADLLDEDRSLARVLEIGRILRDEDGADAIILGCATMGVYRKRVEAELSIRVIDPTQAAIQYAARALLKMEGMLP